ncbi:MAG: phosphopantetheine-binding protein [Myxococcota bacterium]
MSALHQELRQLIAEIGEIDDLASITDTVNLYTELGLDSIHTMEIVLEIEQRYGVKIPEESLKKIHTLNDVVQLVASAKST